MDQLTSRPSRPSTLPGSAQMKKRARPTGPSQGPTGRVSKKGILAQTLEDAEERQRRKKMAQQQQILTAETRRFAKGKQTAAELAKKRKGDDFNPLKTARRRLTLEEPDTEDEPQIIFPILEGGELLPPESFHQVLEAAAQFEEPPREVEIYELPESPSSLHQETQVPTGSRRDRETASSSSSSSMQPPPPPGQSQPAAETSMVPPTIIPPPPTALPQLPPLPNDAHLLHLVQKITEKEAKISQSLKISSKRQ